MAGDKLVFDLNGRLFALDTSNIESIVEVKRPFFIPGQKDFVNGIISLRGEPVTVVDLRKVFGCPIFSADAKRIIIVKVKGRLLGLDIGTSGVTFLWGDDIEDYTAKKSPEDARIQGSLLVEGRPVHIIDWAAIFEEATEILSSR